MTIRFTCAQCSSVLKIKDDRAGTSAQCPKCKTKFIVPEVDQEAPVLHVASKLEKQASSESPTQSSPAVPEQINPSADHDSSDSHSDLIDKKLELTETDDSAALPTDDSSVDQVRPLSLPLSDDSAEMAASAEFAANESDSGGSNTEESWQAESGQRPAVFDDDDDLDSPSMLAGPPTGFRVKSEDSELRAAEVAEAKSVESKKLAIDHFEKSLSSPRKLPPVVEQPLAISTKDEPFDPANFLLSDSSVPSSGTSSSTLQNDSDLSLSDDSDYEVLARPSPRPVNNTARKVVASRPTPEKVDLASAAKMMKKAIKDAQTDAVRVRQQNAKPQVDYSQLIKEIGLIVGGIVVIVMLFVGVYFGSDWVLGNDALKPNLVKIRGTITLGGRPVANAIVRFEPVIEVSKDNKPKDAKDRKLIPVRTSTGLSDDKGQFKMMYTSTQEGVVVGNHRVWVEYVGEKGLKDTPPEWRTYRIIEIKAGKQEKPFDINM